MRAAVDVDGIDVAGGHDFVDLLEHALERDALGRIDFDAKPRILRLQFAPEFAFRLALGRRSTGRLRTRFTSMRERRLSRGRSIFTASAMARMCAGRRAAAAAQNARAHGGGFAREKRKIFRRRTRIDDAVAYALGKAGIGHAADADVRDSGQFLQNRQQGLRAERAVRADDLHIFMLPVARRLRRGASRRSVVPSSEKVSCATMGSAENERMASMAEQQLFDVGKSFENEEIDAALFERQRLFAENFAGFLRGSGWRDCHADAQRAHRAGDQNFACWPLRALRGRF